MSTLPATCSHIGAIGGGIAGSAAGGGVGGGGEGGGGDGGGGLGGGGLGGGGTGGGGNGGSAGGGDGGAAGGGGSAGTLRGGGADGGSAYAHNSTCALLLLVGGSSQCSSTQCSEPLKKYSNPTQPAVTPVMSTDTPLVRPANGVRQVEWSAVGPQAVQIAAQSAMLMGSSTLFASVFFPSLLASPSVPGVPHETAPHIRSMDPWHLEDALSSVGSMRTYGAGQLGGGEGGGSAGGGAPGGGSAGGGLGGGGLGGGGEGGGGEGV